MFASFAVVSSNLATAIVKGGGINESGSIENLNRMGFTRSKCASELFANICDAHSSKIIFKQEKDCIKLIDIGIGMGLEKLTDMFDLYKANNNNNKSMGVSGIGGKAGQFELSKPDNNADPTTTVVFTRTQNGDYWKAIADWNEIYKNKKIRNEIIFVPMTKDEITDFLKDREGESFQHGTTIMWQYSDNLMDLIESQFNEVRRKKLTEIKCDERWDLIFGPTKVEIILKKEGKQVVSLESYDYFKDNNLSYYIEKDMQIVEVYLDENDKERYILDNGISTREFKQSKTICSKQISDVIVNPNNQWKHIGTFTIINGMRRNNEIFDIENPNNKCLYNCKSAAMSLCDYDNKFFNTNQQGEGIKDYLTKMRLYRNNQYICHFELEDFNAKTTRAGFDTMFNCFHHRTEIRYETISTQYNPMDKAMGIQSNKGQNQCILPTSLNRLISYIKKENIKKHIDFFNELKEAAKPKPVPVPPPPISSDTESDFSDSENSLSSNSSSESITPVPVPVPDPVDLEIASEKANVLKLLDRVATTVKNLESLNIIKESKTNIQALLEKLLANE